MSLVARIHRSLHESRSQSRDAVVAPQVENGRRLYVGTCQRKPWEYQVTVAIPHLDTPEVLQVLIDLLRLQTCPPFIMVVDTGSREAALHQVLALRADDLEVHVVAMVGTPHPSDFPAVAMDLALSACRTPLLFATHSDCFPRRRDLLEWFAVQCNEQTPVVGYEMSPRRIALCAGMVSHTATMMHVPTMHQIGFGYSQHRLINVYDPPVDRPGECGGWPDTEILGNMILREHGIQPKLIGGPELNHERWVDQNIDHIRTLTAGRLYSPSYMQFASVWAADAVREAQERVEAWKNAK